MEEGLLVIFHLPAGSPKTRHNRFRWRIYGRDTSSWRGKYTYHQPGFLEKVPHVVLYKGILILRPEDGDAFLQLIDEEGGVAITRRVLLTTQDQDVLSETA